MQTNFSGTKEHDVDIEVVERQDAPGVWSVEIIDYEDEGTIYLTTFFGPQSRKRAEAYAHWQKSQ